MPPLPPTVVAAGSPLVGSALRDALRRRGHREPVLAGSAEELVAASGPGVVAVLGAPSVGGVALGAVLPRVLLTGGRVLLVCPAAQAGEVAELLMAGASGYLALEDCSEEELAAAVVAVGAGGASLHPAVAATVLAQWRQMRTAERPALTAKEAEVLRLLARGLPVRHVARDLALSPKTVESHRSRIYAKLGARTQAQAAALAARWHLVD
jgi:two-component system nitrate/nitrite response regulator NarL